MVIASCLGLPEKRSVCSENIREKEKTRSLGTFVAEVKVKNKRIFCRSSRSLKKVS